MPATMGQVAVHRLRFEVDDQSSFMRNPCERPVQDLERRCPIESRVIRFSGELGACDRERENGEDNDRFPGASERRRLQDNRDADGEDEGGHGAIEIADISGIQHVHAEGRVEEDRDRSPGHRGEHRMKLVRQLRVVELVPISDGHECRGQDDERQSTPVHRHETKRRLEAVVSMPRSELQVIGDGTGITASRLQRERHEEDREDQQARQKRSMMGRPP